MRLTCPNCDAIYEVPAEAVPPEGRDVQCTNCGHSWFQEHPEGALPEEVERRPAVTPDARRVLEEEAAREMAARAEERGRARKPRRAPVPVPRDPEDDPEVEPSAAFTGDPHGFDEDEADAAPIPTPRRKDRRGRDLLPDIEAINGSLKHGDERRGGRKVSVEDGEAGGTDGSGRGFRLGLGLTVLIAAALVAIYVFAPEIAERVPALAPAMEGYAATIDGWRAALDEMARGAAEWLTAWVDGLSAPEAEVGPGEVVVVPEAEAAPEG